MDKVDQNKTKEELETIEAELADDISGNDTIQDEENLENENLKILEITNQLQRLQAEFMNYKKRTNKEKENTIKYANESLITKLLPILDNMDRAFDNINELKSSDESNERDLSFYEGFTLIRDEFINVLKGQGLEEIESDGKEFDANYHHAIYMEESDEIESNHVIETLQKGYMINGRVLRPAMVKVSK